MCPRQSAAQPAALDAAAPSPTRARTATMIQTAEDSRYSCPRPRRRHRAAPRTVRSTAIGLSRSRAPATARPFEQAGDRRHEVQPRPESSVGGRSPAVPSRPCRDGTGRPAPLDARRTRRRGAAGRFMMPSSWARRRLAVSASSQRIAGGIAAAQELDRLVIRHRPGSARARRSPPPAWADQPPIAPASLQRPHRLGGCHACPNKGLTRW